MKSVCRVKNCNGHVHGHGWCGPHYLQMRRTGFITPECSYKSFNDDGIWLSLHDNIGSIVGWTVVDKEDIELVKDFKFFKAFKYRGYYSVVYVSEDKSKKALAHLIIGRPDEGYVVDHVNGNPLDNRRGNLRFATHSENRMNAKKTIKKCSSRYKGVCYDKNRDLWMAYIDVGGSRDFIGRFDTEIEAAENRDRVAKILHRNYAKLNILKESEG